jgi:hypothetical protein
VNDSTLTYIVDRIEGEYAICETPHGIVNVELNKFTVEPKEGMVFDENFVPNLSAQKANKERITQKFNKLRQSNV